MIARCEPECFHRAIYYIKNLSHKQGHNRKENVIVSTEKIRKTGGNNVPLVEQEADAICIAGNIVDRQPQNGGNGLGCMLSQSLKGSMTRFVFWDIVIFSAVIGVLSFYLMGVIERAITPAKRKAKKKAQ